MAGSWSGHHPGRAHRTAADRSTIESWVATPLQSRNAVRRRRDPVVGGPLGQLRSARWRNDFGGALVIGIAQVLALVPASAAPVSASPRGYSRV